MSGPAWPDVNGFAGFEVRGGTHGGANRRPRPTAPPDGPKGGTGPSGRSPARRVESPGRGCRPRLPGLPSGTHSPRGDRRLRGPFRVLGRRNRDRLDGVRTDQRVPRVAGAASGASDRTDRGRPGRADRVVRQRRSARSGRRRQAAPHHAGRPGSLSSSRRGAPPGPRDRGRPRRPAGRRAGSRPDDGRSPAQDGHLPGVGLRGALGGGAGEPGAESTQPQTGAHHPRLGPRGLRRGVREPGVSHLDGPRDPRRDQREGSLRVDRGRAAAGGTTTRRAGRHGHRRRSLHARRT